MIIFRSLFKELILNLTTISLILLIIFLTNQFVVSMQAVAAGKITLEAALQLMVLQAPLYLGYLIPLAVFLSVLLVLGRWHLDSEMTVLYACGLNPFKLLGMLLVFALFASGLVAGLMLWLSPIVQQQRVDIITTAVGQMSVSKVMPRRFQPLGDQGIYYAQSVSRATQTLNQVFVATQKPGQQPGSVFWVVTVAKQARQELEPQLGHFLVFYDGYRYEGTPGQKNFHISRYQAYGVKPPGELTHVTDWPKGGSTMALWAARQQDQKALIELQWRIAMPLWTLVLGLIAFPLTRVNPRQGRFFYLIPAIILYIIYADLLFLAKAWLQKGLIPPVWGMWWVHLVVLGFGVLLLIYRVMQRYR